MITDIEGVRVGHWTDDDAKTGCTVVLFPDGTVASGEVRGGAPATREFALLEPTRLMRRLDAVVLSGGSAFGLAAADGVMEHLERAGIGFSTAAGPVPIVVGMSLYDLGVGDASVRPTALRGLEAAERAASGPIAVGTVGAGTGATVAKWRGPDHRRPGGLVTATVAGGDGLLVAALVAVNAFGEPGADPIDVIGGDTEGAWGNTTIGVVATNAVLSKTECHLVAQSAHDGLARSVSPAHTLADGDAFVVAATCEVELGESHTVSAVRNLAVAAVSSAILTLR